MVVQRYERGGLCTERCDSVWVLSPSARHPSLPRCATAPSCPPAAEKFGLLGLVADRSVPGTLYTLAALLLAAGPAAVYFTPDDSGALGEQWGGVSPAGEPLRGTAQRIRFNSSRLHEVLHAAAACGRGRFVLARCMSWSTREEGSLRPAAKQTRLLAHRTAASCTSHAAAQLPLALPRHSPLFPGPSRPSPPCQCAVALQAVIALTCVLGGSAAWGGASLLSTLQKS